MYASSSNFSQSQPLLFSMPFSCSKYARLRRHLSEQIHFLADPAGAFTEQWDVNFDASALLGNYRSKRYAVKVDGGNVVSTHVEPDNTSVNGDYEPSTTVTLCMATILIDLFNSSVRCREGPCVDPMSLKNLWSRHIQSFTVRADRNRFWVFISGSTQLLSLCRSLRYVVKWDWRTSAAVSRCEVWCCDVDPVFLLSSCVLWWRPSRFCYGTSLHALCPGFQFTRRSFLIDMSGALGGYACS